jgi:hypothetical protein
VAAISLLEVKDAACYRFTSDKATQQCREVKRMTGSFSAPYATSLIYKFRY